MQVSHLNACGYKELARRQSGEAGRAGGRRLAYWLLVSFARRSAGRSYPVLCTRRRLRCQQHTIRVQELAGRQAMISLAPPKGIVAWSALAIDAGCTMHSEQVTDKVCPTRFASNAVTQPSPPFHHDTHRPHTPSPWWEGHSSLVNWADVVFTGRATNVLVGPIP
jgi:hypothetical protein